MLISIEALRSMTNNFSEENKIGQGDSGTVYKGELPNSITIAVKRIKSGAIVGRAVSEFEAEMAVMRTARHRNLVLLI
ncbi:putative receptor protein kinase TMK1-like, partial [Trifolium medium]|nr:putative receptor protein kinase TMK1-like [Trifolium medium]